MGGRDFVTSMNYNKFIWHVLLWKYNESFLANLNFIHSYLVQPLLYVVACREPLLGSDRDPDNETTPAARQQNLNKTNTQTLLSNSIRNKHVPT
jgi:hypothetical protein